MSCYRTNLHVINKRHHYVSKGILQQNNGDIILKEERRSTTGKIRGTLSPRLGLLECRWNWLHWQRLQHFDRINFCYISKTLLFVVRNAERGIANWVECFKVWLHKEIIIIQKKARKLGNNLVGHALALIAKHYATLEYIEKDEGLSIGQFHCQKITRKKNYEYPQFHQ